VALTIKATVFWNVLPCSLIEREHGVNINPKNSHSDTNSLWKKVLVEQNMLPLCARTNTRSTFLNLGCFVNFL
jgi:hypothetical protein